jgi:hypothetical protein
MMMGLMNAGLVGNVGTIGGVWTAIASTTPNQSVSYNYAPGGCPSGAQILSWLTSSYPPGNYALGYIMRVNVYDDTFSLCGSYDHRRD